MKKVDISTGKYPNIFTLVDDEDFEYLNQWKWYFDVYVKRKEWLPDKKIYRDLYMHRVINNTPSGLETDHINRNKLDNRKSNLQTCTRSVNQRNKGIQKNNTSGYKNLYFDSRNERWRIRLQTSKKRKDFGYFPSLDLALITYKELERKNIL